MTKYDLIELLCSADEEHVLVDVEGTLYDLRPEVGHEPEWFDGFTTAAPASAVLKLSAEPFEGCPL